MATSITLKPPGTFVSWRDVRLGFQRAHFGKDSMLNVPDDWLALAINASQRGRPAQAQAYLDAGLVREAYDRDCYEPPVEMQREFAPFPSTEGR